MSERDGRTEKPTPKKKQKAKGEGQIARSPEITSWLLLLLASFVLPGVFKLIAPKLETLFLRVDSYNQASLTPGLALANLGQGMGILVLGAALFGGIGFLISLISNVSQVGFSITPKLMMPKLSRLSPQQNFKKIFSTNGLFEVLKSVFKLSVVSIVAYVVLASKVKQLASGQLSMMDSVSMAVSGAMSMLRTVAIVGFTVGIADFIRQKKKLVDSLMMTKQEVKDEARDAEGDPTTKGRIRKAQITLARRRMMSSVRHADAVIVNPTHYAVAIVYDPAKQMAPVVVAKGSGYVALSIKKEAAKHAVPIVRDPILARALHRSCEIGTQIPPAFFLAVARLLAFVYQLSGAARYYETNHSTRREDLSDIADEILV